MLYFRHYIGPLINPYLEIPWWSVSHVTGYPARSRDRSCDRHTVTATRSPPHGHRHTATATRSPPHGHRHTATATRPPPRPSHPWPGHVPGHVTSHVPGHVMSHVPGCDGTFNHGNLPGPLALGHSRRPLALWHPRPLLPFGPWPLFPRGQHPLSTMADGGLRLSAALGAVAPSALDGLQPTAASGPWGTLGHDRLSGRRRH